MGAGEFLLGKQPGVQGAVFPWTPDQRKQAGDAAFNQLGGIYGTDPQNFWGGPAAWTTAGGIMGGPGGGGMDWNSLIQSILSGGPGGHATGFGAHAGKIDTKDESLQMLPSERIRQDVYGSQKRSLDADASNRLMQLREQQALTGSAGDASSPAALWMQQQVQRDKQRALAEGETGFEAAFSKEAGARRAQALISQAQFQTQASIATAGNKTQASAVNAQLAGAKGARVQQGAEFLLGQGLQAAGNDETRAIDRYKTLNDMNLDWQRPVVNPYQTPGAQGQLGNLFNLGRNMYDALDKYRNRNTGQTDTGDWNYNPNVMGTPAANDTGWDPYASGPNQSFQSGFDPNDPIFANSTQAMRANRSPWG